jgi:hypothetical protein
LDTGTALVGGTTLALVGETTLVGGGTTLVLVGGATLVLVVGTLELLFIEEVFGVLKAFPVVFEAFATLLFLCEEFIYVLYS